MPVTCGITGIVVSRCEQRDERRAQLASSTRSWQLATASDAADEQAQESNTQQ
jgi:hypothetical protein